MFLARQHLSRFTSGGIKNVTLRYKSSTVKEVEKSFPVLESVVALMAGVATVGASAALVEAYADVPKFDPSRERFDQSTFLGRYSKMMLACDPRLLLYTNEQARQCRAMIDDWQSHVKSNDADAHRRLWEAKRIADAALHPDTGEVVPRPFRMSGYVPFNGPVGVAMVAASSTPSLLFWSWVNQSQNALVNYYNRNAASEISNQTLLKSYTAAVASALAVAFGLATLIQRRYHPSRAKELMRFVAFPSAIVSSSLNCYIVRSPEIQTGIPLLNENGENVLPGQTSCVAAKRGVHSTTASRALLQAPVYFLPPFLLNSFFKSFVSKNPALAIPITTYLLLVSFGLGLPATVAVFPQISTISFDEVEDEFKGLSDENGKPYNTFYYNKGL